MLQHEFDGGAPATEKTPVMENQPSTTNRRHFATPCELDKETGIRQAPGYQQERSAAREPSLIEASEERPATSLQSPAKATQTRRSSPAGRPNEDASVLRPRDLRVSTVSSISDEEDVVSFEMLGRSLDRRLSNMREMIIGGSARRLSETNDAPATARLGQSAGLSVTDTLGVLVLSSHCDAPENKTRRSNAQLLTQASSARASKTYRACLVKEPRCDRAGKPNAITSCPPHGVAVLALIGFAFAFWMLLFALTRIDKSLRLSSVFDSVEAALSRISKSISV